MAHNSIAGWIWLGLAFGGLGYGAVQGIQSGRKTQAEIEKKKEEAAIAQLNQRMSKAIYEARKQNYPEAIKMLGEIAADHPNRAAVHLNLGIAHRATKNYDKAMVALERAEQLRPDDWDITAEKATILAERGKLDDAIKAADAIPPRAGHMLERLRADPVWNPETMPAALVTLRAKHGISDAGVADTGVTGHQEMERQKNSYPSGHGPDDGHDH